MDRVERGDVFLVISIATHTNKAPENRFHRPRNTSFASMRWQFSAQIAPNRLGDGSAIRLDTVVEIWTASCGAAGTFPPTSKKV